MIADAESDAYGRICGVESKEIRVLFKIEPYVIVFSFREGGYVSGEVVPGTDEAVQAELRARLRIFSLGNRRIRDASDKDTGADSDIRLQSVPGIAQH